MDARHMCALALLAAGCAAVLLAAAALLVLPTPYARLHALSPASSLGVPLVCLALALDAGPGRAAVKLLFIGALTALAGPVLSIVIGRTMLREDRATGANPPGAPAGAVADLPPADAPDEEPPA
jgi:multicomponent Na+:H+ antiporter subunit G